MYVCAKAAFVADIQQKIHKIVISITSCRSVFILENILN
jgi:hypothetical protein